MPESRSPCPRKKPRKVRGAFAFGEMDRFTLHLWDADLANMEEERGRLILKRERIALEASKREKHRVERMLEPESSQKLELEKRKLMIEAFPRSRKLLFYDRLGLNKYHKNA